jgi:hypothetical protein
MLYRPLLGSNASGFLKAVAVKLDAAKAVEPIVPAMYPFRVPVRRTKTTRIDLNLEVILCTYISLKASKVETTIRTAYMTKPIPIGVAKTGEVRRVNKATLETKASRSERAKKDQKPKVNRIPIRPSLLLPATT